ncbi:helix-turn-helix domain-containing protein [Streptomyces sp. 3N207]|uniref:helix-turn-helix domain-containing protein n=1 Tax=Streptomyces sp. 3N207 TaxID=3457417 RepID=UPI003FD0EBDE
MPAGARETVDHHRALFARIQSFIWEHLGDPGLCPDAVAAAHHISTRSLHRLFQSQGCTVSSWIRRQRLNRARRDLADPRLGGLTIQAIAASWGFVRAADFTRAFRGAYGVAPQAFRSNALRQSGHPSRGAALAHPAPLAQTAQAQQGSAHTSRTPSRHTSATRGTPGR